MRTPLKVLIFSTLGVSLIAGFIPELRRLLALSWIGIDHLYLWQFFSYIFVERGPISFQLLVSLAFNMYLLWLFGTPLYERIFSKKFFTLYFGATLLGGVSALMFPRFVLAGSGNPVFAVLVVWMMLNRGSKLLLFFTLPFKSYILVLGLLGISVFFDITAGDWVSAVTLVLSCIYAYLFALFVFKEHSPFPFLHPFERKIFHLFARRAERKQERPSSKIYDIQSGKPITDDDEKFMDAMLDRISRHGEDSLTSEEKKRMQEISKKRKNSR